MLPVPIGFGSGGIRVNTQVLQLVSCFIQY